jgi:branched-chain amino acid transport system substrate-binding protein
MAASFGQGAWGLQAAVEDLNAQGGIMVKDLGRKVPVKLTILDSESDTTKVGTLAQDLLLRDNANFLVCSPMWPQDIVAVATVAEKNKTPFVAFSGPFEPNNAQREAAGGLKYTWESGFAIVAPPPAGDFRTDVPGYTMLGLAMSYLNQFGSQTNKKVAVFASDDPDGRGWYQTFAPALKGAGFTPVGVDKELGIAPDDTNDFTSIVKQWKDSGAEIMMGNAPAPWVGTLLRQCSTMGFKPKVIIAEKAAMLYDDVTSWGGNLPNGVMALIEWSPSIKNAAGIADTTPVSLNSRWNKATSKPFQPMVGCGYSQIQILADAITRAGTLDKDKVNAALAQTDFLSMRGRAKYDVTQYNRMPISYGQWFPVSDPVKWQMKTIYAGADFTVESQPVFPIPY